MIPLKSYISIINEALAYIEDHINEPISLVQLSAACNISEYHFSRLFHILTGATLPQYVNGRKMAVAAELLTEKDQTVTDVAFRLGYSYSEVFGRIFKKQFGLTPSEFRNGGTLQSPPISIAVVKQREIMNINGGFALRERFLHLDDIALGGVTVSVHEDAADFSHTLADACGQFLENSVGGACMEQDVFYSIATCDKESAGQYSVFFGKERLDSTAKWTPYTVPGGWYASFSYYGEMADMRGTFTDDFYRWMIAKNIGIRNNGIGMLCIYNAKDHRDIRILVPASPASIQQK